MKNKNYYNNLFDSICGTALLFGTLLIYVIALYWSVLHPSEGTNSMVALIALTVLFGTGSIVLIILIITQCFAYWRIENNMLVFKKLLINKKNKEFLYEHFQQYLPHV